MKALVLFLVLLSAAGLHGSDHTSLFNSRVKSAEWVVRPKQGLPNAARHSYFTSHSGVRVTLDNGQQYLIHKGPNFGKPSDTVVTDAANMSNRWRVKKTRDFGGSRTVGDLVKAGGQKYSIFGKHCHRAAKDMMRQK